MGIITIKFNNKIYYLDFINFVIKILYKRTINKKMVINFKIYKFKNFFSK
jgi:hypothetical protein